MAEAGPSRVGDSAPGDGTTSPPSVKVHLHAIEDPVDVSSRRLLAAASFFAGDATRIAMLVNQFRIQGRILDSTVRGWSMTESLPDGSRIRIRCARPDRLVPGQVVAILVKDRLIVHRIAHVGGRREARRFVITRGDSILLPDHPIEIENIVGPVSEMETPAGWRPVPQFSPRRRLRRTRSFLVRVLGAALEIHPQLAKATCRVLWSCKAVTDWSALGIARFASLTRRAALAIPRK